MLRKSRWFTGLEPRAERSWHHPQWPPLGCVPLISAVSCSAGPRVPAQHAWRGPQLPTGDGAETSSNLKLTTHGDLRPVDLKAESLSGGWEWGVMIDHQEVGAPRQGGQGA